ncbi:hypothetical protein CUZ95_0946 [Enterococcus lactis]|nr:hypothetical protein [Enterococcus lactis]
MIKSALFPTKPEPSSSPDFFIDKQTGAETKILSQLLFPNKNGVLLPTPR